MFSATFGIYFLPKKLMFSRYDIKHVRRLIEIFSFEGFTYIKNFIPGYK